MGGLILYWAHHGKTQHIDKAQRETLHAALAGGKRR